MICAIAIATTNDFDLISLPQDFCTVLVTVAVIIGVVAAVALVAVAVLLLVGWC